MHPVHDGGCPTFHDSNGQEHRAQGLHDVIDVWSKLTPGAAVVVDSEGAYSYAEVAWESRGLAYNLLQRGLRALCADPVVCRMRRDRRWYALYVATMRCGVPFMPISAADLGDPKAELKRATEVFRVFNVQVYVQDPDAVDAASIAKFAENVPTMDFRILSSWPPTNPPWQSLGQDMSGWPEVPSSSLLAYCFTGGTTSAAKAVKISHRMALHEVKQYPKVLPLETRREGFVFLQNSSSHWGAAVLGQLNVPLAFGGAAAISLATMPMEVIAAINSLGVTSFGAVPSVLAHIHPEEVPEVRSVIAWAEELPAAVAQKWCNKVVMRDLLIATEYWLVLYAKIGETALLQAVGDVELLVLEPGSLEEVAAGEIGELCVGGPTLCPGYANVELEEGRFIEWRGSRFFRSRDLVRRMEGGFEYCGRCDDLVKVGGRWLDVRGVQEELMSIQGVKEAKLMHAGHQQVAFVILDLDPTQPAKAFLDQLRRRLPTGFRLHVLSCERFPRLAATGKIDRAKLTETIAIAPMSEATGQRETGLTESRRQELLGRFGVAYQALMRFCKGDCRRVACLSLIYYYFQHCPESRQLQDAITEQLEVNGDLWTLLLALGTALSLPHLTRLAKYGSSKMKGHCTVEEWLFVFCLSFPCWMINDLNGKAIDAYNALDAAAIVQDLLADVQIVASRLISRQCDSCSFLATAFPSQRHCCELCASSSGRQHDPQRCLRLPQDGYRRCDGCDRFCTFLPRHCCYKCAYQPGYHGPRCQADFSSRWYGRAFAPPAREAKKMQPDTASSSNATGNNENTTAPSAGSDPIEVEVPGGGSMSSRPSSPSSTPRSSMKEGAGPCNVEQEDLLNLLSSMPGAQIALDGMGRFDGASLTSLTVLQLQTALRDRFGRVVLVKDISGATTVSDLQERVQAAPATGVQQKAPNDFRLWTFGCNNGLSWLFQAPRALSSKALSEALRTILPTLLARHPALRLSPPDKATGLQVRLMDATAVLQLARDQPTSDFTTQAPSYRVFAAAASRALGQAWPVWRTKEVKDVNLDDIYAEIDCDPRDVQKMARGACKVFMPHFQLQLLTHSSVEASGGEGPFCHLQVILSHAIADSSAVLPLISDIGKFVAAFHLDRKPPPKAAATSSLHFGAALEDRLLRSIRGDEGEDAMFFDRRRHVFDSLFCGRKRGFEEGFMVRFDPDVYKQSLKNVAQERLLLAMLTLALARTRKRRAISFILVDHGRDSPAGASNVVGFFTDFRVVEVATAPELSSLGVMEDIASTIRERRWRRPKILETFDGTLLNIVPAPTGDFGGFVQEPTQFWPLSGKSTSVSFAFEFQVEQLDSQRWSVNFYWDGNLFGREFGTHFHKVCEEVLLDLVQNPLGSCWGR